MDLISLPVKHKLYSHYLVFNNGDVINGRTNKKIKPYPNQKGYLRVKLSNKGNIEQFFVHRLVASVFVKNPHNKDQVHHKDHNKLNNWDWNLEYVTNYENACYKYSKDYQECEKYAEPIENCPF